MTRFFILAGIIATVAFVFAVNLPAYAVEPVTPFPEDLSLEGAPFWISVPQINHVLSTGEWENAAVLDSFWEVSGETEGESSFYPTEDIPDETVQSGQPNSMFALPWSDAGNRYSGSMVLPPWTVLHSDGNEWSCWGRTYQVSISQPLMAQITSQGEELLSRPMFVGIHAGGRELEWVAGGSKLTDSTPSRRSKVSEFTAGSTRLRLTTSLEFDGFLRLEMRITGPEKPLTLDSVFLDIPMRPEQAKYILTDYSGTEPSKLPDGDTAGPFTNWLWLGGENVGLTWCTDTSQNWHNENPRKRIEFVRRRESTILRLRLIDTPIRLDGPIDYTFMLQPTPAEPSDSEPLETK